MHAHTFSALDVVLVHVHTFSVLDVGASCMHILLVPLMLEPRACTYF